MRPRTLLGTALATAVLSAVPLTAHAAPPTTEYLDRAAYDATPEVTAGSLHIDGATRGPLGGYIDVAIAATDGSLPAGSNVCEPATVTMVLTVSPGETLTVTAPGEVCTGFYGSSYTYNAGVTKKTNVTYAGTAHRRTNRPVMEGLISASSQPFFGAQAAYSGTVKW